MAYFGVLPCLAGTTSAETKLSILPACECLKFLRRGDSVLIGEASKVHVVFVGLRSPAFPLQLQGCQREPVWYSSRS